MANDKGKESQFRKRLMKELGVATAVLIPLAIGFTFLHAQVIAAADRVIATQQRFTEQTSVINRLITLRTQYDKFGKKDLNILSNVIPQKDSLINLSQEFQAFAAGHNLKFGFSFRGEDPASPITPGAIHFSINVSGATLEDIKAYIQAVSRFHYLTTLDSVHIARTDQGVDCIIIGHVYYQNPST